MKKILLSTKLWACLALPVLVSPVQAAPDTEAAAGTVSGPIAQAALQSGIKKCLPRIEQVSKFVGFSADAGALLMVPPPPAKPENSLIPLLMEVPSGSGPVLVSATFAPNQANGCGATYDAIVVWRKKCQDVAAQQFASLPFIGNIKNGVGVLNGGPFMKVLLMPVGDDQCIAIKKEIVR